MPAHCHAWRHHPEESFLRVLVCQRGWAPAEIIACRLAGQFLQAVDFQPVLAHSPSMRVIGLSAWTQL